MKSFFGCPYDIKKGRPYFNTKGTYNRPSDTIVIWFAYTPSGRVSKYWHTLRLNADHYGKLDDERLEEILKTKKIDFPKLRKGYTWSEPYRYS